MSEGTKIGEISTSDVLTDIGFLVNGESYGELEYGASMTDAALRVIVTDPAGDSRTFELHATEVRE